MHSKNKDSSSLLFALHGFLGGPKDWDFLQGRLQDNNHFHAIDLYSREYSKPQEGLLAWAESFNKSAAASHWGDSKILMGYSLGGRLALHALMLQPNLWKGAVIISSAVGNLTEDEKIAREASDALWAERFSTMDWEEVMAMWNSQPLFSGSSSLLRSEVFYRGFLGESLIHWSQAKQNDLSEQLKSLSIPILWVVGLRDAKYVSIANSLQLSHPLSLVAIVPDAGHRVHFERSEAFCSILNSFLSSLQ